MTKDKISSVLAIVGGTLLLGAIATGFVVYGLWPIATIVFARAIAGNLSAWLIVAGSIGAISLIVSSFIPSGSKQ